MSTSSMTMNDIDIDNEKEKEKEKGGGDGSMVVTMGSREGSIGIGGREVGERVGGMGDEGGVEVKGALDGDGGVVEGDEGKGEYMSGWRLWCLIFGLCLSLLLSTLETTIVSTSLVSITNALKGFQDRDWVVTSYLLTYTGFLVIYAKFSGIFGVKFMMLFALLVFTVFSIVCGAATGMTELIILRSLQGIGGSGIYSMVGVVVSVVVSPAEYGKYMAVISSVFVVSSVLGPILGGVINDRGSWRWVFLLNAPAGATAIILIVLFLPSDFSSKNSSLISRLRARFTLSSFARLDLLGSTLMLAASILLVFALEEAETRWGWGWGSRQIIGSLVASAVCWVGFVVWEVWVEERLGEDGMGEGVVGEGERKEKRGVREPVFKMGLLKNRVLAGMLLNAFLTGIPFTTLVVSIPQYLQSTLLLTPTHAGLALLPLLLMTPFSSALSSILATNPKLLVPPVHLVLLGSVLQLLGVGLYTTLDVSATGIQGKMYAFEVMMGLGFGLVLTSLLGFIPLVVTKKDMPVMIGAITQVRVLGGTIGLAISTVILNSYIKTKLKEQLTMEQIAGVSQSLSALAALTPAQQLFVKQTFAEGYNRIWIFVAGFSGAVVASVGVMWEVGGGGQRRLLLNDKGEVEGPTVG